MLLTIQYYGILDRKHTFSSKEFCQIRIQHKGHFQNLLRRRTTKTSEKGMSFRARSEDRQNGGGGEAAGLDASRWWGEEGAGGGLN